MSVVGFEQVYESASVGAHNSVMIPGMAMKYDEKNGRMNPEAQRSTRAVLPEVRDGFEGDGLIIIFDHYEFSPFVFFTDSSISYCLPKHPSITRPAHMVISCGFYKYHVRRPPFAALMALTKPFIKEVLHWICKSHFRALSVDKYYSTG